MSQTDRCPWCGKDSYEETRIAFFSTAECTWCKCKFKRVEGKLTVVEKGKGKKAK